MSISGSGLFDISSAYSAKNWFKRFVERTHPTQRRELDHKIANYIQKRLDDLLADQRLSHDYPIRDQLYISTRQFLKKWSASKSIPDPIQRLERRLFLAQKRMPQPNFQEKELSVLRKQIQSHDTEQFQKWVEKYNLPEEVFYAHPEFVQFVMDTHLHRHFKEFQHKIFSINGDPWILVEGTLHPWRDVQKRFFVEDGMIYSLEEGEKKRWVYLDRGLIKHDPIHWSDFTPLKKLDRAPGQYQIQIVTAHVNQQQRTCIDRAFQGVRHSWIRLITPEGYVYSFGRRPKVDVFHLHQPIAGMEGFIETPDIYEFRADHKMITTLPISDSAAERVLHMVREEKRMGYHAITGNCCSFVMRALEESGINRPDSNAHVFDVLYEWIVPQGIRKILGYIPNKFLPAKLSDFLSRFKNAVIQVMIIPLVSFLGGWTAPPDNPPLAGEPISTWKTYQRKGRAIFRSFQDLINPDRLTVSMPHKLADWQKKQGDKTIYS